MNYDPYYDKVVLLVPGFGIDGATSFPDLSPKRSTLTTVSPAKTAAAVSKFYGSSYMPNGGWITVPDKNCFIDFTQPFTFETWAYVPSNSTIEKELFGAAYSASNYGVYWLLYNGGTRFEMRTSQTLTSWTGPTVTFTGITTGEWHHLAVSRTATQLLLFIDGVLKATTTITGTVVNQTYGSVSYIGTFNGVAAQSFNGYMQDFRVTQAARYTTDFTPPSPLWCDADTTTSRIIATPRSFYPSDAGLCRIAGYVDELGVVGAYLVRLFDRASGRLVGETWSAASGYYEFKGLAYRPQGYFAVAFDHGADPRNAGIADYISPELV